MVTHSPILHGGSVKRATVKELHSLIKYGTIHVPSPLRLLRLCNGKRCESWHTKTVKHANQGLGTFLCNACLTKGPESLAVRIPPSLATTRTHNQRVSFDFDVTNKNIHSCILYSLRPSSVTKLSNEHIHIDIKMNVQARTRLSFLPRTRQKVASRGEQSTSALMGYFAKIRESRNWR
jgi:hypothetical protein